MKPEERKALIDAIGGWLDDHEVLAGSWLMWAIGFPMILGLTLDLGSGANPAWLWWMCLWGAFIPELLYVMNGGVSWLRSGGDRKQARVEEAIKKQKALEAEVL